MKTVIILILSAFCINSVLGQGDVPFEKQYFKDNKSEFKEALDHYERGLGNYTGEGTKTGYPNTEEALKEFKIAYDFNPNSSQLNLMMGICYLYSNHKYNSLQYLEKAKKLNPQVDPEIDFLIGNAFQIQYKFDEAIANYEYFRKTLDQKSAADKIFEVNKKIEECKNGKKLVENPERVWIDNLGKNINSAHAEYAPLIATDESSIFFTARRPDTEGGGKDPTDNEYFEDIYRAEFVNGAWTLSKNIGKEVNGSSHDATAGLSPDGNTLFIYDGASGLGDIFITHYIDGKWTKREDLGKTVNDKKAHESSASISFDGKTLYFVSDREGGIGGHDIYFSVWDEVKQKWGEAQNIGPVINTKYDETGVFIHPDGKTMYFSSKGHTSMGGYDIFYSTFENGVWTTPVNIGYPVNSPDDDVHFVVSASGRTGYYASFQEEGLGEKDIYKVTFLGPEKEPLLNTEDNLIASIAKPVQEKVIEPKVEVSRNDLAILKGIIRDEKTQQPISATVEIIDNGTGELVSTFQSDGSGKYLVSLPAGKNYGIAVKADSYLFHSENFNIPLASGYREYIKNIDLKKVEVGKIIVLRNIFYDLDKATLRPESKSELERLIKLMNENPTLKIELGGHTDSRGSATYNQQLSEKRAMSVVNYLIDHGISKDRLKFAGYGETQLIVPDAEINKLTGDAREEAHQQNRRTEFKILEI